MRRPAMLTFSLLVGALACGVDPSDDVPPAATGSDDGRGPPGETDDNGSCGTGTQDTCGGQGADGCRCNDGCEGFGDCCSDYADVCLEPPDLPPEEPPPPACAKNVVLMGYWPPTNEMLRPWSDDPLQNPDGWQGENWRELGYDVFAFFPEFPPDGDPTNDQIGDDGAVGSPEHDLRVDYQATSADFWRIVDTLDPIILITTSRGGSIGWEIEAIDGGHGQASESDPSRDWAADFYGDEHFPTQSTIEPRSWDAISEFRAGVTLPSALPLDAIFDATSALDLASVEVDDTGTSGNFLSGFLGLHGIAHNRLSAHNLAAGHIHVGIGMPTATARALMEATVEAVLLHHPAADAACR